MAIHSSILAWRIPWTEEPGGLYSTWDRKELNMTEWLTHTHHKAEVLKCQEYEYLMGRLLKNTGVGSQEILSVVGQT